MMVGHVSAHRVIQWALPSSTGDEYQRCTLEPRVLQSTLASLAVDGFLV